MPKFLNKGSKQIWIKLEASARHNYTQSNITGYVLSLLTRIIGKVNKKMNRVWKSFTEEQNFQLIWLSYFFTNVFHVTLFYFSVCLHESTQSSLKYITKRLGKISKRQKTQKKFSICRQLNHSLTKQNYSYNTGDQWSHCQLQNTRHIYTHKNTFRLTTTTCTTSLLHLHIPLLDLQAYRLHCLQSLVCKLSVPSSLYVQFTLLNNPRHKTTK